MKNLKPKIKHPFKAFLFISFLLLMMFSFSSCCFTYNKGENHLTGDNLVAHNSNWIKSWVDNYWESHSQFILELEYKPKGKTIGSEPLYKKLPWKYQNEIKKGDFKYFGSFASGDSLKINASKLSKEFYKNDFSVLALKPKNGVRRVYIKSKFFD